MHKKLSYLILNLHKQTYLISQSTKYKHGNKHFDEMNFKLNNLELNKSQKVNLLFALAKANEDLDQVKESFTNLSLGNRIKRKTY